MRERSQTTPRRRGPKFPLPAPLRNTYESNFEVSESPYYTIDNTEDIYGTTLSPTQRCYVDPWDLENYDYVRKYDLYSPQFLITKRSLVIRKYTRYAQINSTPIRLSPEPYYDTSLSTSPYYMASSPHSEVSLVSPQRLAVTMPRNRRQSQWNEPCPRDCCSGLPPMSMMLSRRYEDTTSEIYGMGYSKYDDYMSHMTKNFQTEEDPYTGYGGISSSSSTELHSSIDEEHHKTSTMTISQSSGYKSTIRRRPAINEKPAPRLEFPAPPSTPPYDYPHPYAMSPHCSVSDCYGCSMVYATPSPMLAVRDGSGEEGYIESTIYGSAIDRSPSSSLYSGIYGNKFGLSKKGLLQIDYSCSWNDLDRVMGRQY